MCVFVFVCVYVWVCVCVCVTVCDCVSLRFSLVRADPTYSGSCGSLHQKSKKRIKGVPPLRLLNSDPVCGNIYIESWIYWRKRKQYYSQKRFSFVLLTLVVKSLSFLKNLKVEYDLEGRGVASMFRLLSWIRRVTVLARMCLTFDLNSEENASRRR